jgi:tetratricopeptide (TPR) repeat protein
MTRAKSLLVWLVAVVFGAGAGWLARCGAEAAAPERIEEAMRDRAAGRFEAARDSLLRIHRSSPSAALARAELGFSALALGDLDTAEQALVLAVTDRPDLQTAREELRWLYFNTFRVRDVERLLESWLGRNPDDFRALVDLHLAEFRRQLPREGRPFLAQWENRVPAQLSVLRGLAYCDWQAGDAQAARDRFTAALDLDPTDTETRLLAAEFALEQGWSTLANELLSEAAFDTREAVKDDRWWGLRGRLARLDGHAQTAVEFLSDAVRLRPRESAWIQERGLAHRDLGQPSNSASDLQAAVQLEQAKSDLAELVFSGRLENPDPALLARMVTLCEQRGQRVAQECWNRWNRRAISAGTATP